MPNSPSHLEHTHPLPPSSHPDNDPLPSAGSTGPIEEKGKTRRKATIDSFEMMRVLGKGFASKVMLVRHKSTSGLYALKVMNKKHCFMSEKQVNPLAEEAVMRKMATESKHPLVIKLWWSFHDKDNLYLVMDFHSGGDLATQLARWGRLGRDRTRFYAAEIVDAVEALHAAGVIYRDLKPENVLIGIDGHIVLTDFGCSKAFPRLTGTTTVPSNSSRLRDRIFHSPTKERSEFTSTFCGTAEYLAPELILGSPYSYEVDWWTFGTMLYEMLTGNTPFCADNHVDMYCRVLQDDLRFPNDMAIDPVTKRFIYGLLQRNPALRIREPQIKRHPYFSVINWSHVYHKRYIPPFIPYSNLSSASDTQNFNHTFLSMEPTLDGGNHEQVGTNHEPRPDAEDMAGKDPWGPSIYSQQLKIEESTDVFDSYSFEGCHSTLMDREEVYRTLKKTDISFDSNPTVDAKLESLPPSRAFVVRQAADHAPRHRKKSFVAALSPYLPNTVDEGELTEDTENRDSSFGPTEASDCNDRNGTSLPTPSIVDPYRLATTQKPKKLHAKHSGASPKSSHCPITSTTSNTPSAAFLVHSPDRSTSLSSLQGRTPLFSRAGSEDWLFGSLSNEMALIPFF